MHVTKVERQTHHPRRINLYLDGKFAFAVQGDVLSDFNVKTGDDLDEGTVSALLSREEIHLAKRQAFRYLTHRQRSEYEIRTRLFEKEHLPSTIDAVIDHLRGLGLIDDLAFARALLHDLQLRKPCGKTLLQQKLRSKGISSAIIVDLLREQMTDQVELGLAMAEAKKVIERYQSSRKIVDEQKQRQRLARYLARRGFSWGTIGPVVRQLFSPGTSL